MTATTQNPPAAFKPGDRVPVAWKHTLHMEHGQTSNRLTYSPEHPFGEPGRTYSAEYTISSTPLYADPVPPSDAGDGLRERTADPQIDGALVLLALAIENGDPQAELQARIDHLRADYQADRATHLAENEALQAVLVSKGAEIDRLKAENGRLTAERDEAATDRDALLGAAGFKPGPKSGPSLKVILDDIEGMRPAMIKARREAERAFGDAILWQMSAAEGHHEPLLLRVWQQRRAAESRATRAEAECERMKGAVEAENEACAAVADDHAKAWGAGMGTPALVIANAIRDRRASSTLAAIKGETT